MPFPFLLLFQGGKQCFGGILKALMVCLSRRVTRDHDLAASSTYYKELGYKNQKAPLADNILASLRDWKGEQELKLGRILELCLGLCSG